MRPFPSPSSSGGSSRSHGNSSTTVAIRMGVGSRGSRKRIVKLRRIKIFVQLGFLIHMSACFQLGGKPANYLGGNFGNQPNAANPPSNNGNTPIVNPPQLGPNFESLYANIFIPKCIGCHSSVNLKGNYDMSTFAALTSAAEVTPGNPQASLLYTEVASGKMPPGDPLSSAEIQSISDWITAGAQDDQAPTPAASPSPFPSPSFDTF